MVETELVRQARELENAGNPSMAIQLLDAAGDDASSDIWLLRGDCFQDMEDDESALWCYQQGITKDPLYSECWSGMALSWHRIGNIIEARHCYEQSIVVDPQNVAAQISLAGLLSDEFHDYENALECIHMAEELEPENGQIFQTKANILMDMKDYEAALKCYERAADLGPDTHERYCYNPNPTSMQTNAWYLDLYNNWGLCYKRMARYQDAIRVFRAGLEYGDYGGIYNNMGLVFQMLNRNQEAVLCFQKSMALGDWNGRRNLELFYPDYPFPDFPE